MAVEGNIRSGKSTFLQYFRESENVEIASEPVEMWKNVRRHNTLVSPNIKLNIFLITTRKRSLQMLCFYTCLSVILFRRGEYLGRYPLGRYTPWVGTSPGQVYPQAGTPPAGTPPTQCMPGYGQQAGGTHPTRMHSCLNCTGCYSGWPYIGSRTVLGPYRLSDLFLLQDLMYKDSRRWALTFQSYVQLTMLQNHSKKQVRITPPKVWLEMVHFRVLG